MRWVALLVLALVIATGLAASPRTLPCLFNEGNWWKPLGRTHCQLEGWRYITRGFR